MSASGIRILAVDDEKHFLDRMIQFLSNEYEMTGASSAEEALAVVSQGGVDAVLLDLFLGDGDGGFDVLERIRDLDPEMPVIIVTQDRSSRSAVTALEMGAAAYVNKVDNPKELKAQISRALDKQRLHMRYRLLKRQIETGRDEMIGDSMTMRRLHEAIMSVAPESGPVLVVGETGSGKELVVQELHRCGVRKGEIVSLNCAAVSQGLIESELFGHVPGAFNEATLRRGALDAACDGTLFLDEITEAGMSFQVKLNRVLDDNKYRPVGADLTKDARTFTGRIVAATNLKVREAIAQGRLREDLYYRFSCVLQVPPLRDRRQDIPQLVTYFLGRYAAGKGCAPRTPSPADMDRILAYDWPGNVRQLKMAVESFARTGVCPMPGFDQDAATRQPFDDLMGLPYKEARRLAMRRFQHAYVPPVLAATEGDLTEAAKRMGISVTGLKKILPELQDG